MPLTVPTLPARTTQCTVSISSLDGNINALFPLTETQVAEWSDEDLVVRMAAFKEALKGLLVPGADVQAAVTWSRTTTLSTPQPVETA